MKFIIHIKHKHLNTKDFGIINLEYRSKLGLFVNNNIFLYRLYHMDMENIDDIDHYWNAF